MSIRNFTLSATLLLTAAACGGGGGSGVGPMGSGGARLPGFAPASTTNVLVAAVSDQALSTLCDAKGATVLASCGGTDYCLVKVPDGSDVSSFLKELESESSVDDATPDSGVGGPEGGGSTIPLFGDDPLSQVAAQIAVQHTGAVKARSRGISGQGVLVAVIDTGVAFDHPLIAGHVSSDGWDFIDDDADPSDVGNGLDDNEDGSIDEGVGHGTFVASLVLAVAPDATILPIRALNSDGVGTASGVARAIAYAVAQGADVINFSGGLSTDLRLIQQAVEYAQSHDVVVYASAGNHAGDVDFPGMLPEVECVTALDGQDRKASFAAFGAEVDLCAWGIDIVGAHPLSPSGTARWSGTSFSTALVTGSFALLREWDGKSTGFMLAKRLRDKAVGLDAKNPSYVGLLGSGRVNVDYATRGD